jgi:hypothetical protein
MQHTAAALLSDVRHVMSATCKRLFVQNKRDQGRMDAMVSHGIKMLLLTGMIGFITLQQSAPSQMTCTADTQVPPPSAPTF